MKSNNEKTVNNFVFLGLPGSGKTTYFSVMAHHFQLIANRSANLNVLYLPTEYTDKATNQKKLKNTTADFIADCNRLLARQDWPDKTQDYFCAYTIELQYSFNDFDISLLNELYETEEIIIDYHDYPGEAFEVAFGNADGDFNGKNASPKNMQELAEDMKKRIKTADGLFLIIDVDDLFNGTDASKKSNILASLLSYIQKNNKDVRIAVIFNKIELFNGLTIDFRALLRKQYGNAYSCLRLLNHRFFDVFPVGNVETDTNGKPIPPPKTHPKNILEPVRWLADLSPSKWILFLHVLDNLLSGETIHHLIQKVRKKRK